MCILVKLIWSEKNNAGTHSSLQCVLMCDHRNATKRVFLLLLLLFLFLSLFLFLFCFCFVLFCFVFLEWMQIARIAIIMIMGYKVPVLKRKGNFLLFFPLQIQSCLGLFSDKILFRGRVWRPNRVKYMVRVCLFCFVFLFCFVIFKLTNP